MTCSFHSPEENHNKLREGLQVLNILDEVPIPKYVQLVIGSV